MLFINAVVFSGSRGPIALLRESKTLVLNDLELLLALFSFFLLFSSRYYTNFRIFFKSKTGRFQPNSQILSTAFPQT
jgi:hypothetical protein